MGRTHHSPVVISVVVISAVALAGTASAFVPSPGSFVLTGRSRFIAAPTSTSVVQSARLSGARCLKAMVDPGLVSAVDPVWLHSVFTGIADAAGTVVDGTASGADVISRATDGVRVAVDAVTHWPSGLNLNPLAVLTDVTKASITGLHDLLHGLGMQSSYGLPIILFTLLVKGITFPLTYQQMSSSARMQMFSPKVQELQAQYADNPKALSQAIQQLYAKNQVNPTAGCLPALAQIPILISIYRSLLNLAKENKMTEGFLWIPSLEGPTFGAPPSETLNWLKDWTGGAPKLGWHDTLAYLTIPIILILTQWMSMKLTQPSKNPKEEGSDESTVSQQVLMILPLMLGWFSLNVPSALGLYWILNNVISTGTMLFIRSKIADESKNPTTALDLSVPLMEMEKPQIATTPMPQQDLPHRGMRGLEELAAGTVGSEAERGIVNKRQVPGSSEPQLPSKPNNAKKEAGEQ